MKSIQKYQFNDPDVLHQEAVGFLADKNYKKALNHYKILFKHDPKEEYRLALRDCYVKRANDLCKKGMYKEAEVLYENHLGYCIECSHAYHHINLLLVTGSESKAAHLFVKNRNAIRESDVLILEEIFAALLLACPALVKAFPRDSLLVKHYAFANEALIAYSKGDFQAVESSLANLSFRSPFRQLRQIIRSCLLIKSDKQMAVKHLEQVPAASPFYSLANTARLLFLPRLALARLLPTLTGAELDFLAALKGWDKNQREYIDKLRLLTEKSKPQLLFTLIVNGMDNGYINKTSARRMCYGVLPSHPSGLMLFEKLFGSLLPGEKSHINALASLKLSQTFPPHVWDSYQKSLAAYQQTPEICLKRALALRQAVKEARKIDSDLGMSGLAIESLEESIKLDPQDKSTYLEIINYYQTDGDKKGKQAWIKKTLGVFPDDRDVLFLAIANARDNHAIDLAIKLTNQLLQMDPVNMLALNYLTEFKLIQARSFMLQRKWSHADYLLENLKQRCPADPLLQLNLGLRIYLQKGIADARAVIEPTIEGAPCSLLKLFIEAGKLFIDLKKLERDLNLSLSQCLFKSKGDLLESVKLLNQLDGDNKQDRTLINMLKDPLKKAFSFILAQDELIEIADCLINAGLPKLLNVLLHKHPHLAKEPLVIYHILHGKIKADLKISEHDSDLLEAAYKKAIASNDRRTAMLIETLLFGLDDDEEFF